MKPGIHPPANESMTLVEAIDFHSKHNTYRPVYVFSEDGNPDVTNISYLEFGRAADRVAHHLRPRKGGPDPQVVAVVALSDSLLYLAIVVGIMRAGLVPYPMSPRNTPAAIVKLLNETSCHRLITTQETLRPLLDEIKAELPSLVIEEAPPLFDIFPRLGHEKLDDPFEPYSQGPRAHMDEVAMYIHSSGSTGMPKTIAQTTRILMEWSKLPSITDCKSQMAAMALPSFHTMGIMVQVMIGYFAVQPICLYPPIVTTPTGQPMIPSPDNLMDHIKRTGARGLIIVPALLQVWAKDKEALHVLGNLDFVIYSGGGLPSSLGNFLTESGVYLSAVYGTTEIGAPTMFYRREEDSKEWDYMEFADSVKIRWDPQGDGTYELQLLTCDTHHVAVENLPDTRGYASSDLWVPHPTKSHLWKIVGRKDDVIVHTSGEKTVPAPIENVLMSSPYIMGTVMFGREREQAGVLIELKPAFAIDPSNEDELIKMRNMLWPIVEEANKVAPAFSRIFKELILITSPQKPLPRAGKGTVMRKAAVSIYAPEIDAIYDQVNATVDGGRVVPPSSWDIESTIAWLKNQVEEVRSGQSISVVDDFFYQGVDSLGATILRRRIVSAMKNDETLKASQLVSQSTIYNNPSVEKLAKFLVGIIADPDGFVLSSNRVDAIDAMINKFSTGLSAPVQQLGAGNVDEVVVLLTGSTGNLGAQILEALLRNSRATRVYALNRASGMNTKTLKERHVERFVDKGLDITLLESPRLVLLEGDASQKGLGLASEVYDQLLSSVTIIIHNAWKLDFNQSLPSFEPNVQGTRNLIDLARASRFGSSVKFLFTSSVSSAYSWDKTHGPYPEEVVTDSRYAVGNGYGESKYVAERVLAQSGLQATSFRIGQITGGAPNGAWATTDWVPILLKSSIALGALPSAIGVVSWLPMHAVSQAILDVAWSSLATAEPALNIVHPRPISWDTVFSFINEALVQEGAVKAPLPIVTFQEWFALLEKVAAAGNSGSDQVLKDIPAIKLLDFFRLNAKMDEILRKQGDDTVESGGLATFSTAKIASISETVGALSPLEQADASLWIKYWKDTQLF
ncbi:putative NRPS-like protein biosynthetic cluster [Psilocybe cubensis]|uniref:NRPS-like protein biosynthetic cluster n=2 Tax=Psilocybe cubensis TaxID=181762 RepID=A0ACB8GJX4_PSICU|nr:putative NRPS-like protein biosynthetic cluster [Psilocybe cubensis]KAH9475986.1 putative NRPS-like protein biosynthetic cluster [Psilocybe cubensis]